jgi:hypothetical protein
MVVTEPAVRDVEAVKLVADEVALVELVALLIAVARSASVSLAPPFTMLIVAACPEVVVMVSAEDGKAVFELVSSSEYHDPDVARLLTTTLWVPVTVPVAAVAVRYELLEDETVRADNGPLKVLSESISVAMASVAV